MIADVLIGERVPQRLVLPRVAPRPGAPRVAVPALLPGSVTIHIETRAPLAR